MKLNVVRCMYGDMRAKAQLRLLCALWLRRGPEHHCWQRKPILSGQVVNELM